MTIRSRFDSAIKAFFENNLQSEPEEEVLANGQVLSDKRTVEDPNIKFNGIKLVRTTRRNYRLRNNVDFFKPEYDLPTIANAVQLDGLLRRIVNLFVEQIMKNGFEYVSKNEKIQKHVAKRIKEIERLTGYALYEIIEQIARQLVTYGNAYLIKVRSDVKCRYGKPYRLYGKNMNPIVGLFVAEATTIEIGLNSQGNVVQYKQTVRGNDIYYDERDVIHFAFNKIPGTLTGMSSFLPVLDDVRALRKLEEEIEILGFQYSIPLYLYKVGNKDIPPAPGEVDEVSATINSMPAYGMLVVPGHHDIEVPTNNNTPVDILAFVNHFKKRIFAGTGVSPVAMGEMDTSNRNTSEVLDSSMQTVTKSYQQILKHRTEQGLFSELLLDGGYATLADEIEFNFPEIDLEQQIKFETNVIQKWINNLIDLDEARNELDLDKKMNEKKTFSSLITVPEMEQQGKVDEKIAQKKANSNKVAPANQHGKSTGRPKYVKNSIIDMNDQVGTLVDSLTDSVGLSDFNTETLCDKLKDTFITNAARQVKLNIHSYKYKYNLPDITTDENLFSSYLESASLILDHRIRYFVKKINKIGKTDLLVSEIKDFMNDQQSKIENLSLILTYDSLGYKSVPINHSNCEKHNKLNLHINDLNYFQIPPFEYGCKCFVEDNDLNGFKHS